MYSFPVLVLLALFGLVIIIQLYYYLFRFGKVVRFKPQNQSAAGSGAESLSVIVCAHNELSNLEKLIPAIFQQEYPQFELVVVDDRSSDGSDDFLKAAQQNYPGLKIVRIDQTPPHFTAKKYALTMGIKHAKKDLLVFTDADCMPASPQWLANLARPFAREGVEITLGFSQYQHEKGFLNSFIRFETQLTGLMYLGAAMAGRPYMGVGRNLAYRKSFFLEKKGFLKHRTLNGGDDDLFVNQNANKENTRVSIGKEALVYSIPKRSVKEWYRQKLRHMVIGKWYNKRTKWRLGLFTAVHLLFWITFVALLSLWIEPYWVMGGFLIRTISLYWVLIAGSKKLGAEYSTWYILLLDFLLVFYYVFIGLAALFTNKITWK
jgi:biofilm PGA synthesis N-glycosyltransferase PgaC